GQIVRLGGGEPTLYKDIFKIIRTLKKINKKPILITNGIKLKNINYLKRLVDAGLFGVHFSLNSMEKERNKHISDKLSAFANLTKFENLYLIMSTTLERDRPEPTIRQILEFYINNIEHINEWRIRSAVSIGKFRDIERYTTYELVEMVCKAAGKDIKSVIKHYRREKNSHTLPCRMTLQIILFSSDLRDSFIICNTQDFVYGGKQSLVKLGVMLARQFKLRHLFRLAYKTIFSGKLKVMRLEIRSWPTKETLDMMDISLCPSLNIMVNLDGGKCARPFCYSLIMNNKDDADYR
ncbi:MAG: radical SAM protein, partial [Candidatus Woesearchaeota archaeon]